MRQSPDHDVIVVGAGPTGLLLAAELTRFGLNVAVLERRADAGAGSRAIGVHAPVLAALEASGATERILAGAVRIPRGIARSRSRTLGEVRFDRLRLRFPFVAAVPQATTEAAVALGGPEPARGVQVVAIEDLGDRVRVETTGAAGEREHRARVVVVAAGAEGRHLAPRELAPQTQSYRDRFLMTDVIDAPSQPADTAIITLDPTGVLESFPLPAGGRRLVAWDRIVPTRDGVPGPVDASDGPDDTQRLRHAVATRTGDAELAAAVVHSSAFGIRRVLTRRMRAGRVFVIGDAAHEVSPIGGQGMNLGLLDAAALAPHLSSWLLRASAEDDAALARWERERLLSARTAARLAGLNTALGRARPAPAHGLAVFALGVALTGPLAQLPARAYAMGFDRSARGAAGG